MPVVIALLAVVAIGLVAAAASAKQQASALVGPTNPTLVPGRRYIIFALATSPPGDDDAARAAVTQALQDQGIAVSQARVTQPGALGSEQTFGGPVWGVLGNFLGGQSTLASTPAMTVVAWREVTANTYLSARGSK